MTGQRNTKALIVALSNGEVRVYNEKLLVSVHVSPNPVTALWFGRYGREDNTLLAITKSGALDIKVWAGRWGSVGAGFGGWEWRLGWAVGAGRDGVDKR